MIHYLWWVPGVILVYGLSGWLTHLNNQGSRAAFVLLFLPLGIWPFVSRVSTHVVFDAILYDFLMGVSLIGVLVYATGTKFTALQFVGVFLTLVGLILVRT